MAKGIFISYRRDDSAGHAGRIYDRLEEYYGSDRVFRDIEDIVAGDDFVRTIRNTIDQYAVMLVVIGPTWLTVTDASGRRRLDNPDDVVRLEIAAALERPRSRVIPVLVNGARMPRADELPAALAPLAQRHAHEILDTRFAADVDQLIKALGGRHAKWFQRLVTTGAAAAVVAAAAGIVLLSLAGPAEIAADVTLYEGGGEIASERDEISAFTEPPDSTNPVPESETNPYRAPFTVTYDYERRSDDAITVASVLPYRDLLRRGGPIEGGAAVLYWDWPRLSVKVVNNSDRVIQLSEIELHIRESEIDTEPIVMIRQRLWERLTFGVVNYGWGPMVDPSIEISIASEEDCRETDWVDTPRQPIGDFVAREFGLGYDGIDASTTGAPGVETIYNVGSIIPNALRDDLMACVFGVIDYENQQSERRSVRFKTFVMINGTAANAAVSVSEEYLIFLEAGRADYRKSKPIALEVTPQSVEHFVIRLGTDKSASFEMSVSLRAVGEELIDADDVSIDILTPVYDPHGLRGDGRRR